MFKPKMLHSSGPVDVGVCIVCVMDSHSNKSCYNPGFTEDAFLLLFYAA